MVDAGHLETLVALLASGEHISYQVLTSVSDLAIALLTDVEGWVRTTLERAGGPLQYFLIFLFAAIPWFEILLVIPIGIALGLNPLLVGVFAFVGNALPIYGIVIGYERLSAWLEARRGSDSSGSKKRAVAVWNRYGLPGLALCSPIVTGVHLAALIALGLGARGRDTLVWMTVAIGLWTVVIVVLSVIGLEALGFGT